MGLQPSWDREKFRDEWMSSGVQNVGDMNTWLQNSGWGQYVGTGGKKGDEMYLPNGDTIDAVYAAGAGGNQAGPMWTGKGNWQQNGKTPYGGQPGSGDYQQTMNTPGYNGSQNYNIGPSQEEMNKQNLNQQHQTFQAGQKNRTWQRSTGRMF